MRAAWGYTATEPPYVKLGDNGISWPYFPLGSEGLTRELLDTVRAHPGIDGCGVYAASNWWGGLGPEAFSERVDGELKLLGWKGNPPVCLDIEVADLGDYCIRALRRWRQLRPARTTDLTIEGHKGGVFSPVQVVGLSAMTRYIVPQCYDGAMQHVWDTYAMTCDLAAAGFALAKVAPFYDAAKLPDWWGLPNGYAFTWERLP